MQIFVSGTWRDDKAIPYKDQAHELGLAIAARGFDLACGPGTGISRYVIDGYRSAPSRGIVRYYLPFKEEMELVGEAVEEGADEIIQTELDYPMRNVWQIKQSQGLFVLTGGDGTLEEIVPAVVDYGLPVAIVEQAGGASRALAALVDIFPEWKELVSFGPNVQSLVDQFLDSVTAK